MSELGYKFNTDHFYNILKKRLKDKDDTIIPNIDKFTSKENYSNSIKKSIELQKSPYIIIIDPYDNKDIIDIKFNKFNSLAQKERELSNYYSYILYGYDVEAMYGKLISAINTANNPEENNNLVIKESSKLDNISNNYNKLNIAIKNGDFVTVEKFKKNITDIKKYTYNDYILQNKINLEDNTVSPLIFPKVTPWFTLDEMNNITEQEYIANIDKSYYKSIKEAYDSNNSDRLLSLGWNPSVPVNNQSIEDAKIRQLNYANKIKYLNFSDIDNYEPNYCIDFNMKICPLYLLLFEDGSFAVAFANNNKLVSDLKTIYVLSSNTDNNSNESIFVSKKIYTDELIKYHGDRYVQVLSIFVDSDALNKIYDVVSNNKFSSTKNISLIYSILSQSRNMLDLDRRKILYAYIINILLDSINGNSTNYTVTDKKKIFMLYQGKLSEYDPAIIDNIMRIIYNEDNLKDYLTKNELDPDDNMVKNYIASPIIYSAAN